MVICGICKMTVPLANSVDCIWSIELARSIVIYPKIVMAVLVGTAMTIAICPQSVDRMRPTDSSRTPVKASKWPFFMTVPGSSYKNHREKTILTAVETAVRITSWHFQRHSHGGSRETVVRILTAPVLTKISNHHENVSHGS